MPTPKKYQFKTEEPYGWLSPGLRESLDLVINGGQLPQVTVSPTKGEMRASKQKAAEAKQRAAEKEAFMGNTKKPNLVQSAVKAIKNLPRNRDEIFENTMANLGVLSPANWIATDASALDAVLGLIPGCQRDYDRIYLPTDKDNPRLSGISRVGGLFKGNPIVDEVAGLVTDFAMPGVFDYAMTSAPRVARGLNALERGVSKIGRRTTKAPSQEFVTTATEAPPNFTYSYTGLPEDVAKGNSTFNPTDQAYTNYSIVYPTKIRPGAPPMPSIYGYPKADSNRYWWKVDPTKEHFGLGTELLSRTFDNFKGRLTSEDMNLISKKNNVYLNDAAVSAIDMQWIRAGYPPYIGKGSKFGMRRGVPFISISESSPYSSLIPGLSITTDDIGNIVSHEMAHKLMRFSKRFNKIYTWTADETAIHLGIDPKQARQALGDEMYEYLFRKGGNEIRARYTELKNIAGVKEFTDTKELKNTLFYDAFSGLNNDKYTLYQLFDQSNTWDKLRDFGNIWAPMMGGAVFAEPFLKTNSKTQYPEVQ